MPTLYQCLAKIIEHIVQIYLNLISEKGISSATINNLPLRIHDIVIFQQALTHAEVIFFYFFLGIGNGLRNKRALNNLAFFQAHTIHPFGYPFRSKQTHQIILQRYKELRRTRISLTTGPPSELSIDASGVVSLCTNNRKPSSILYTGTKFNIGTTAGHIGRYGYCSSFSCFCHNLCLSLMELSIQDIVTDITELKHTTQQF